MCEVGSCVVCRVGVPMNNEIRKKKMIVFSTFRSTCYRFGKNGVSTVHVLKYLYMNMLFPLVSSLGA